MRGAMGNGRSTASFDISAICSDDTEAGALPACIGAITRAISVLYSSTALPRLPQTDECMSGAAAGLFIAV